MRKNALSLFAILMGAMPYTGASVASSMRCGNHVIDAVDRQGPGKYEILKKCGKPKVQYGNTWIYDTSAHRKVLRFNAAGLLIRIEN